MQIIFNVLHFETKRNVYKKKLNNITLYPFVYNTYYIIQKKNEIKKAGVHLMQIIREVSTLVR